MFAQISLRYIWFGVDQLRPMHGTFFVLCNPLIPKMSRKEINTLQETEASKQ